MPDVVLQLTKTQVRRIVAEASEAESATVLLPGMTDPAVLLQQAEDGRLSRSLLRGFCVLAALPRDRTAVGVVDLASQLGESSSTTHRYLRTLIELGLVEREATSRRYRLSALFGQETSS